MQIDTEITSITAVRINDFTVKNKNFQDINCTHLGLHLISDDLQTKAVVEWILLSEGKNVATGHYVIEAEEYAAWSGDNLHPFGLVAGRYGISFPLE